MSQFSQGIDDRDLPAQDRGPNVLGIVGFVLAFCLSPLGLLVSLIALASRPRGFAIAGVIVGLIGSSIWAFFGVAAVGAARSGVFQTFAEFQGARLKLDEYAQQNNGAAAPSLAAAGLSGDELIDHWGTPYGYEVGADGKSWTFTVAGADKTPGTADDLVLTSASSPDEVNLAIQGMMETSLRGGGSSAPSPTTTPTDATPADAPEAAPAEGAAPEAPAQTPPPAPTPGN
jgi:hypothetical protein